MTSTSSRQPRNLHPWLFALYPVLFLYTHNMGEVLFLDIIPSLVIVFLITTLLWGAGRIVFRDPCKAAIAVSLTVILFFFYDYIYAVLYDIGLRGYRIGQWEIGVNTYLLPLWTIISVLLFWRIKRTHRGLVQFSRIFNVITIALMGIVLVQFFRFSSSFALTVPPPVSQDQSYLAWTPPSDLEPLPDIYFIILDGYARRDVLKSDFDYDNSVFLGFLKDMGFYVVEESRSNYMISVLSITSALNMNYLDDSLNLSDWERGNQNVLKRYLNNKVFQYIRKCGYETTIFTTGYTFLDRLGAYADTFFTPGLQLNDFEEELWRITPLAALDQFSLSKGWPRLRQKDHIILFTLEQLGRISARSHPHFIMAHIVCPHIPFYFGRNGRREEVRDRIYWRRELSNGVTEEYRAQFTEQTTFINNKMMDILKSLLGRDGKKPIVVLISDHGNRWGLIRGGWPQETLMDLDFPYLNLCAIYYPDGDYRQLYPSLSLVNVFRVVFNKYIKTNLPLLDDHSYISTEDRPDRFVLIDQLRM